MADEQQPNQKNDRRWLANVKNFNGQNGPFQKVMLNNLKANNEDGTPNQYYAGALIWADAKTGKNYHVKQMAIRVKQNGQTQITIDLENEFEVTPIG